MLITRKHLSRRTVLKGMGVTLGLPLLDAMVPAGTAWARAARGKVRFICIEVPHGSAGASSYGLSNNLWSPAATGGLILVGSRSISAAVSPARVIKIWALRR